MRRVGLTGGIGAGKSTVSAMLAERGAAIVDGDQVARDLQSPSSPVLDAMAERFGQHIINDDGSLDRAAVAEIVFTDKAALADLNAIVHPAMQAEIQAQIDAHKGTDRIVVLDFPLLGENPRKDLGATIVVDIPYELAVERAVGRGMDEADVRNRIESQISREKRLETATHVIDNSGDMVDLVAQVDRLWSRLEALPPTDDVAAESDQVDVTGEPEPRTAWVFGYGSLVSPVALRRTIERLAEPGADFFEATLTGYGRRWNYGVGHIVGSWTLVDGTAVDDGTIVALGLVESADEEVNGAIAHVTDAELEALDRRERFYDRVDVTGAVASAASVDDPIFTYVPRPEAVERYQAGRDAGIAGIRRTYWDLVHDAFAGFGDDALERYRSTTPEPDVPVVDVASARER